MVEHKQHEQGVTRIKGLLERLGCLIRANDSGPHGKGGYRFDDYEFKGFMVTSKDKPWTPIIDVVADMPVRYPVQPATTDPEFKHWPLGAYMRIGVMVNGMKSGQGHNSDHAVAYDTRYYEFFGKKFNLWITPFMTTELVGKKALFDFEIYEAIWHTLTTKTIRKL